MKEYPLSPVDYVFTGPGSQPITFAYYYPQTLKPETMQEGLDQAPSFFPLINSRLIRTSENTYRFRITEGKLNLETREADLEFSEVRDITRYIEPVISLPDQPLARMTLTQTPGGSVLGVSISHALTDGFSYFHFLSSWARLCRNQRILKPALDRRDIWPVFNRHPQPMGIEEIREKSGLFPAHRRLPLSNQNMRTEHISLARQAIQNDLEITRQRNPGLGLTENDVITARVWKEYLPRWIQGGAGSQTYVTCPYDFRRIVKTVPATYLGCAICFTTADLTLKRLTQLSVPELAVEVRKAVRRVNENYVFRFMETLDHLRLNGLNNIESVHLRHPRNGIIITNLTRMPVRDLDFGSGSPGDFIAYIDVLRGAAILRAEDGVDILISCPADMATPVSG